jgi:hypothetical protein
MTAVQDTSWQGLVLYRNEPLRCNQAAPPLTELKSLIWKSLGHPIGGLMPAVKNTVIAERKSDGSHGR